MANKRISMLILLVLMTKLVGSWRDRYTTTSINRLGIQDLRQNGDYQTRMGEM